ncbi:MAG: BREX-1 system adenine-specific DNA-methyltransferase PglX [Lachnospiraceae bacterium]|nr:BREX-1 system adenine-specific DNA-methyltransferase PglX [Lachnospiraceae bacterium]
MDKAAIKNFAIEARKILMKSAITEAGFYGITKDECRSPLQKGADFEVYETVAGTQNRIFGEDRGRRASLVEVIQERGFDQVIEETAYTWFNRIIAIRFMEINNYLPTRVRVLSSETGSVTPDIVTQADTVELDLTDRERDEIQRAKRENRYDDAFRMLFVKQCNELNKILPGLFEKTDDYMELLLKITYTGDGVIRMLIDLIPEDDLNVETEGQVEIIGWMYQYYNTELKDDTFAKLKKNIKITKERIPAATQLFTPDWIVRYMVENSLGRVWIEHLRALDSAVDEKSKAEEFGWKYYLPEAEQEEGVEAQLVEIRKSYRDLTPQDITCIDPCMGSGHILVYMFDVLMDIYRSEGFSEREAVFDILEKNIRGLDIDRRAYQLSYFALMMKARGYNRIFFRGHENMDGERVQAVPQVYAIEESNPINREHLRSFGAGLDGQQKDNAMEQMNGLLDALKDAKEYGSILQVEDYDWGSLRSFVSQIDDGGQMTLESVEIERSKKLLGRLVDIEETLAGKYDVVVTNPPYMSLSNGSGKLNEYIKKYYSNSKADLYAVFIERCSLMVKKERYQAMITQHSWMFLSVYEKLRKVISESSLISMVHLGTRAFEEIGGEVVQTTAFVLGNSKLKNYRGVYSRLINENSQKEKEEAFLQKKEIFCVNKERFNSIPGKPIAYWVSEQFVKIFELPLFYEYSISDGQNKTGNNAKYVREFWEVSNISIGIGKKWLFYAKGGGFRKWYGNLTEIVDWSEETREFYRKDKICRIIPEYLWYKVGITWSLISNNPSFRILPKEATFDVGGSSIFLKNDEDLYFYLGLLNSRVFRHVQEIVNPTINIQVKDIRIVPVVFKEKEMIKEYVEKIVIICRDDWDFFENSWDFKYHPLVPLTYEQKEQRISQSLEPHMEKFGLVQWHYERWEDECKNRFEQLKANEEELNRIFIDIYGLQDELTPEVEDKDITVRKADLGRDIRSLISYAVGCMFGRYSLDEPGLIYAGGEFDPGRYKTFPADKDAIIPITDEAYFEDDIVGRFEEFIRTVYGEKNLEQNLDFIADALGTKGTSSREKIRNYFLNSFSKDHCSVYSVTGSGKRPIYWLFDTGKQNGFKCLVYLHRYTPDTVGLIRSDYLTKVQSMIENALKNAEYAISESSSAVDKAQATKKRNKYIKQLAEIRAYYPALSHIALQRIALDLDDGVKVNYAKFQGIEVGGDGEERQKIDLLAKI